MKSLHSPNSSSLSLGLLHWLYVFVLALVTVFLLTSARSAEAPATAPAGGTIRIGAFASISGAHAAYGTTTRNGIQLAVEEANAKGGVLGKQIALLVEDNASKAGESATAVQKLVSRDKVVALLGEVVSSRSLEAAPIAQRSRVPMISSATTSRKLTEQGDYIFRVCYIDEFQGEVLSKFALSQGFRKVAILIDSKSEYSTGLSHAFRQHFTANGGTIVRDLRYSGGDKDFRAQLTTIKFAGCDAIFTPGYYGDAGLMALQARDLEITVPLLGGDGWDEEALVKIGGKAIEGSYFSTHFSDEDPSATVQDFLQRYEKRFGARGGVASALAYDSARLLIDSIQRGSSDAPVKIRDNLAKTSQFIGVTGTIRIDSNRNAVKSVVIVQVKDGRFRYVATVDP